MSETYIKSDELKETKLIFNGEEIKILDLKSFEELDKAHAILSSIICSEIFDVIEILAAEKDKKPEEIVTSKYILYGIAGKYFQNFVEKLEKTAGGTIEKNWDEVFRLTSSDNKA